MPTYEIQGPDGKTYSIDGPEGASREEVIAAIQARMQTQPAAPTPKAEAPAPVAPAPKKAAPVEGSYGFMGEGIEDTTDVKTLDSTDKLMLGHKPTPSKTYSRTPFRPEVRAALENKYNEATPKERKKLAAAPGAVGDVFRQQAQEDERAKNLPEVAQRLNPRKEFDYLRTVEPSDDAEIVKGAKSNVIGLQSMWEGVGASKDVGIALNSAKAIDLFNKIDSGELDKSSLTPAVAGGDMSPIFRDAAAYLSSNETKRKELRDRAVNEIQSRKDFVDAAVKTIQQYQEENKVNKGRTENLTDVQGVADFSDWLAFNLGAGAVQLAPIMIAAATTGIGGVFVTGVGMELGGQTQSRINFILNKVKDEKDPKAKADAVFNYVQKTGDLSLATAIAAGAIDMALGPAARIAKEPLRQIVREKTRLEIAKAVAKAVPVDMLEEGVAGGLQETLSIATERILEEQGGDAFSEKNIKRVVDALAAEAVAGGGAGVGAGALKLIKGPGAQPEVRKPLAEATEGTSGVRPTIPLEGTRKTDLEVEKGQEDRPPLTQMEAARDVSLETTTLPPATPEPVDARLNALVDAYVKRGFSQEDAQTMAQFDLSALAPQQPFQDTTQQAVRSVLQAEAPNVPSTEPPPNITQPSTGEQGIGLPSKPTDRTTGRTDAAIKRGLGHADDAVRSIDDGEARERAALEEQYQRAERILSKAFNQQAFPNLAPVFGADWMRQTMASNPTPQEFQEAAYAKLDELSFDVQRVTGTIEPAAPKTKTKVETPEPGIVRKLALEEQKQAGWNPNWPFVPVDLSNADFRQLIVDDPNLTQEEKNQIFEAGKKLNIVPKNETATKVEAAKPVGKEPPVQPGMTRLYHGSATNDRTEGPAWFSTNREYAKNYRPNAQLQYVDYPTEKVNAALDPEGYGQTVQNGFTWNVELDSSETGARKILKEEPSVTKTTEAKQTKKEGQAQPATKPAASAVKVKFRAPTKTEIDTDRTTAALDFGNGASALFSAIDGDVIIKGTDGKEVGTVRYYDSRKGAIRDVEGFPESIPESLRQPLLDYNRAAYADSKTSTEESGAAKKAAQDKIVKAVQKLSEEPTVDTTESLEQLAGRKETLEFEEANKALLDINEILKIHRGVTATGEARKRAPGGGAPVREGSKTKAERNEESIKAGFFRRGVNVLLNAAKKYTPRQEIGSFPTVEEWEAAEDVRAENLVVLRGAIYGVSRLPGTAKAIADAKQYIENLKPAEREAAKKEHEKNREAKLHTAYTTPLKPLEAKSREGYIAEQQFDTEPDLGFYSIETARGALTQILDSPNDVEAALAARLLQKDNAKSLENVDFIVVDKSTKLKDKSVKRMLDKGTVGVFVPDTVGGTIYVRGDSYDEQGINNEIVLHEAMHASGSKKIAFTILAKEQGEPVSNNLAEAVDELQSLMERAKAAYDSKGDNVSVTLKFLHDKGDAFTDIQEFYAYGLTNADMKEFLLNDVEGTNEKTSGFDDFISLLMRLFGIDPKLKSGLKDLVLISNEVMQAKEPEGGKLAAMAAKANLKLANEAKAKEDQADKEQQDIADTTDPDTLLNKVGVLTKTARTLTAFKDYLVANVKALDTKVLEILLPKVPRDTLFRMAERANIPRVKEVEKLFRDAAEFRHTLLMMADKIDKKWVSLGGINLPGLPSMQRKLANIMHDSTIARIDPSKSNADPKLNKQWEQLNDKAKEVYIAVRNFYEDNRKLAFVQMIQNVQNSAMNPEAKEATIARLQELYGDVITPYFPLMRYGKYWAQFGKGDDLSFVMFDSATDKEKAVKKFLSDKKARGDKRSEEEIRESKELSDGNDIKTLQDKMKDNNKLLNKVLHTINNLSEFNEETKDSLAAEVFQMHLMTLPEASFQKAYIHRKDRKGFSDDALRNFVTSAARMSQQLTNIKYGPRIRRSLDAAADSIEGRPDRARAEMIVKEIRNRYTDNIEATYTPDDITTQGMNIATKLSYLFYMTRARHVISNLWAIPSRTMPVMSKYFGPIAANKEIGKLFATGLINSIGVTQKDTNGNITYTMPSFASSKFVRDDPELTRIAQRMRLRGVPSQDSQTYNLLLHKKTASMNKAEVGLEYANNVFGAANHGSERIVREMTFFVAYKMARTRPILGSKTIMSEEDALEFAQSVTEEALYNYSPENSPPWMKNKAFILPAQFKKWSMYTGIYYMRNFRAMLDPLPTETKRGAAYALAGSYLMAMLGAGVKGAYLISTLIMGYGLARGLLQYAGYGTDEDEDDFLKTLDIQRWFTESYLKKQFGNIEVAGHKLSKWMRDGVFNTTLGGDIASSISEGDLIFRELPDDVFSDSMLANIVAGYFGAAGSIVSKEHRAYKDWQEGDYLRALSSGLPSVAGDVASAYKYTKDGARTRNLDVKKYPEQFTQTELILQILGYKPADVVKLEDIDALINKKSKEIDAQRTDIMRRYFKAEQLGNSKLQDKIVDEMIQFNTHFPHPKLRIDGEAIFKYREGKIEDKMKMLRGLKMEPQFYQLYPLREQSLEDIERAK